MMEKVFTVFIKYDYLILNHKYKKKKKTDFDIEIVIDGTRFHKIFREMNKIGDHIDISCTSKNLDFFCMGDLLERKTTLKINDGTLSVKKDDSKHKIIQGIYDIKNFILFTKCATLCNDINVYMKNDFALTICYSIPSYGTFSVSLTPTDEDILKNEDYGYSDNEENIEMISNDDDIIDDDSDSDIVKSNKNSKNKKNVIVSKKTANKIENTEDSDTDDEPEKKPGTANNNDSDSDTDDSDTDSDDSDEE